MNLLPASATVSLCGLTSKHSTNLLYPGCLPDPLCLASLYNVSFVPPIAVIACRHFELSILVLLVSYRCIPRSIQRPSFIRAADVPFDSTIIYHSFIDLASIYLYIYFLSLSFCPPGYSVSCTLRCVIMKGDLDLSLSQSFGGLRIANPDDSPGHASSSSHVGPRAAALSVSDGKSDLSSSPSRTETSLPAAEPSSFGTGDEIEYSPISPVRQSQPSYPSPAAVYESQHPPPASSSSLYQDHDQQQQQQQQHVYPSHPHPPYGSSHSVLRNGSSAALPTEPSYRIRTDSTASSESQTRGDARTDAAAYQAGVPVHDNTHSDRSYGPKPYPAAASGGLPLMRKASKAQARGSIQQQQGSPYGLENGPPASSEQWQERGAAVSVRQELDTNGKPVTRYVKKGVRDFSFGQTLGEGSYSTVVLATDRQTLKKYAVKILDKRHIIKEKKVKYVNIEKDTLNRLTDHPGIVRLYYTFQDERSLYFVIDLCKGGELLGVLKKMTTFDEECTRFYGAQILDTIDYMHKRGVIHRDLKPENVLLDSQMNVKITDFGTAKLLDIHGKRDEGSSPLDSARTLEEERASSFVGTAEYVSPELLTDKNACKASDLWAFGCIIYQLLAGRPPFKAANEYLTFQKIVALDYEFPAGFPLVARDLVERLLVLDPTRRLQIEHIKNHEFFHGTVWGADLWKRKAPRLKSYVPPARDPIKLNGGGGSGAGAAGSSFPPKAATSSRSSSHVVLPRVVTELPPPSQIDVEWSPVLEKSNERILKMGNVSVTTSSPSHGNGGGESETSKKFSRFFMAGTIKKRNRLAMVTSHARIIVTAAGGDEKKAKFEISLLAPGTHYRSVTDSKGLTSWVVDTVNFFFFFFFFFFFIPSFPPSPPAFPLP